MFFFRVRVSFVEKTPLKFMSLCAVGLKIELYLFLCAIFFMSLDWGLGSDEHVLERRAGVVQPEGISPALEH